MCTWLQLASSCVPESSLLHEPGPLVGLFYPLPIGCTQINQRERVHSSTKTCKNNFNNRFCIVNEG